MMQSHENLLSCPPRPLIMDRRWQATVEIAPTCPRCDSPNTKFCYYNNYSLTQPRYFCKGCRRYWTKGGSLRNVPVGGGCRKNRRAKSSGRVPSSRGGNSSESDRLWVGGSGQRGSSSQSDDNLLGEGASNSEASTIDLATVYANYLNQQPDLGPALASSGEFGNVFEATLFELSPALNRSQQSSVQFSDDQGTLHCNLDGILNSDRPFSREFISISHRESIRNEQFINSDPSLYDLQSLAAPSSGVVIADELFWSNSRVPPNLSWQSSQPNGFESAIEDHIPPHQNFTNGVWSSFDIPVYDPFNYQSREL